MTNLFNEIEGAINEIAHGWTSVPKAQTMASMILALRPEVSLEIGVYAGKGLVSMALAHKAIDHGVAIGVDPYQNNDSAQGQLNPDDHKFWSTVDHEAMMKLCTSTLTKYALEGHSRLVRMRSDQFMPPDGIGLLRIDGNHGEEAMKDTLKFAPHVIPGGFLVLDDLGWTGGATNRAAEHLRKDGWRELFQLDDGLVFQRK